MINDISSVAILGAVAVKEVASFLYRRYFSSQIKLRDEVERLSNRVLKFEVELQALQSYSVRRLNELAYRIKDH